ncbi:MAG: hypothetical protein IH978_10615, partial [Nitrospinae bacterium]|nr:hypothetical protein [Nitrospinota bacterium]
FVAIATFLLVVTVSCTPSSAPSSRTPPPNTSLAQLAPTPNSTPDIEREAIVSFTLQALEIETKRNDLIEYFAGLRDSVGIHGQALAIERFFSVGVPATLKNAPPSGIDGMTTLSNTFLLLDSPPSLQSIKDALIRVYQSEIQLASNQAQEVQFQPEIQDNWFAPIRKLVYPEITKDTLGQLRQMAEQTNSGPAQDHYQYKVETVWFGLQEFRQQSYTHWAGILQNHAINPQEVGVTIQNAPDTNYRAINRPNQESILEELYGPLAVYTTIVGTEDVDSRARTFLLDLGQKLHAIFRKQQQVGIFVQVGVEAEPNWKVYVQTHRSSTEKNDEAARILRSIIDMTPEQRDQAWLSFEPGAPGTIGELQDLIRIGMRATRGAIGADFIASRVPYMVQSWLSERPQTAAGTPVSFLDFLVSRLGLTT